MKRGAPGSVMSPRIRVLLVLSGLLVVCAVVAVVYVATRLGVSQPAVSPAPPARQVEVVQVMPDTSLPPEPVTLPRAREPKKSADPTPPVVEVPVAPAPPPSPEEVAQAEVEKQARHVAEQKVIQARESMIHEFKLTPEQVKAAEPVLASFEKAQRSLTAFTIEGKVMAAGLERQARENAWTPEQTKQMEELATREFIATHQSELFLYFDAVVQAFEELRPHLTAEQMPGLDKRVEALRKAKDRLLQGTLK